MEKEKIIVVGGPTATGKTDIAIALALEHNGEIISADSRQVYKGLDIGSAKVTQEEMKGVPHYMLDVADPKEETYSVALFKKQATQALEDILSRGKLPIICGGTGFYIDTLIYNQSLPEVEPNTLLRKILEGKSADELYAELCEVDPKRAQSIDRHNKVRLIRALEIVEALGSVPEQKKESPYDVLYLCLELDKDTHHNIIEERITKRMKHGMLQEVKELNKSGVPFSTLERFGLEYRYLSYIIQNPDEQDQALTDLASQTKKFAKRQYTWFMKNKDAQWFNTFFEQEALKKEVAAFLKS